MKLPAQQPSISPREFHRRCCEGLPAEVIDVRTPPEFAASHITHARLLPLQDLDVRGFLHQRNVPHAPVYIVCQSGTRARKAMETFHREGFEDCVVIEGGMDAWKAAGLPVAHSTSRGLPLQQQVHLVVGASTVAGALLAIAVDKWFALLPLITGCGLTINGFTGWCGLGLLLAKMPWNRSSACSPDSCCEK